LHWSSLRLSFGGADGRKIDVGDTGLRHKPLFVLTDEEAALQLESVVGEEQETELGNELESLEDVLNVCFVEKVAEVEPCVAHLEDFQAFVDSPEPTVNLLV